MELSRFFDAEPIISDTGDIVGYDREYKADEFAEYFRMVLTDGILNGGTNLQVYCTNENMNIKIKPGFAWIRGYLYKVDDAELELTHEPADVQNDRIDRIVVRWELEKRKIYAAILKGDPRENPSPPALVENKKIKELSLAQVRIIKGKSFIQSSQITDERLNTNVCGVVNSLISADTTEIFNQFQAFLNEKKIEYPAQWKTWFDFVTSDYENRVSVWLETLKTRISETDVTRIDQNIINLKDKTESDGLFFAKLNAWN